MSFKHLLCIALLLAVVLVPTHTIAQSNIKRVLVLNAYHDGFHWTDRIMQGIRSVFDDEEDIELFVDYMDTKRSSDQEHFAKLRSFYAHKYRFSKFDAIISSDDHALNFLLTYRDEIFPGTPVFFCGINDFQPSRIAGHRSFTGVFESYDVPATFNLMLRLHPETKKIAVITDATVSGKAFKNLVEKAQPGFAERIEINYLDNLGMEDLKQRLGQLQNDTLALWAIYLRTPEGKSISSKESVRIAVESSSRPTYCIWDVVGQGVVGGKVTSPNYQGKAAAEMALKVLRGENIENLPVSGSPMVYLFDYNAIKQFNIDENSLPAGSVILNRPFSVYDEYKEIIWMVSCFVLTLLAVILALIYYIQKRRQAEEARKHIFANAPIPMATVNLHDNTLSFNNRFTELYGYTVADISTLDEWWLTAFPDATYRNEVQNSWLEIDTKGKKEGHKIEPIHREIICKRGLKHTVEYSRMVSGGVVVFSMIDITNRIKMETQLRQAQKMEAIGIMAGGIAHDFNNLLAIIIGNLNLIQHKLKKAAPVDENIEHIQSATSRAIDLVKQILAFSRREKPELAPVDLITHVADTIKLLRSTIPTTVEIMSSFSSLAITINADATQLQQIIINVCANAVHAMGEKGLLKINLKEVAVGVEALSSTASCLPGRYARLTISDTGTGMAKETMDKIFDPFFTTKRVGEGTGMGLSVAHGIVEQHGGFVTVESTLGQGTAFNLYFPVIKGSEGRPETRTMASLPTGGERILLVDDEESIVSTCSELLESLGYKVTSLTSAIDALEIFKKTPNSFDLVFTDQTMPELSGTELSCELLKVRVDIPIIICSGHSAKVSKQEARRLGIREFCTKPMDIEQLATVIRKVLDESNKST